MVIRGSVRGNGKALAYYLTTTGENERIEILNIDGRNGGSRSDLVYHLTSWSLMSELTKSEKGIYHAVINPAYGEDRQMTPEQWNRAADILAKEVGFEGQRRAIVLHEKDGRIHAHVIYERYNHERGIMVSDSFNQYAQDRARHIMEREFGHQITPDRNRNKTEVKRQLSELWQAAATGNDFVTACAANGYAIAKTAQRRAYSVVDSNGIAYDLTRQIEGVRAKEIAQKLEGVELQTDHRKAIKAIRQKQLLEVSDKAEAKDQDKKRQGQNKASGEDKTLNLARAFALNRNDMLYAGIGAGQGNEKEKAEPPDDPIPPTPVKKNPEGLSMDDKERKKQEYLERLRLQMDEAKQKDRNKGRTF